MAERSGLFLVHGHPTGYRPLILIVALLFGVSMTLGGCGGSSGGAPADAGGGNADGTPQDTTVASVKITPGAVLLTALGESQMLAAQAYNAAGEAIAADVAWSSNDVATVSVDSGGQAVAEDTVGSALITATAGGVESLPSLALVAMPAINSVLVSDEQFVDDPVPVDPNAEFDVGYRYQVTVTDDVEAEVGDILIASGGMPVAGRVVDVVDNGDGTLLVTLEFVPLSQVFTALVIDEEFDLSNVPIEVPEEIANFYDVSVDADGVYVFEPKPGVVLSDSAVVKNGEQLAAPKGMDQTASLTAVGAGLSQLQAGAEQTKNFGPFVCKFEGSFPLKVTPGLPRFSIAPALYPALKYNSLTGGLEGLSARGTVISVFHIDLSTQAAIQAKFECKAQLGKKVVPLNGAIAAFMSPILTFDYGFALGGKLEVTQVDFTLGGRATLKDIDMGIICPFGLPACTYVTEGTPEISVDSPNVEFPNGYSSLDITPFVQGFVTPGLEVGPAILLGRTSFGVVQFKVGAKMSYDLDTVAEQIRRDNFSVYKLALEGEISPKTDSIRTLNFLRSVVELKPVTPKVKLFDVEIDRSFESGLFVIDNLTPAIGDNVNFTLAFASNTESFLSIYDVGKVNLYHVADSLSPNPVLIGSATPTSNTGSQFSIPWTVNQLGGAFYATVESDVVLAPLAPFGLDELVLATLDKPEVTPIYPYINDEQYVGVSVHMARSRDPLEDATVQFTSSHPQQITMEFLSGTVDAQGEFSSRLVCLVDVSECNDLFKVDPQPSFHALVTLLDGRQLELTINLGG